MLVVPIILVLGGTLYSTSQISKARKTLSAEDIAEEQQILKKGALVQMVAILILLGSFVLLKNKFGNADWVSSTYFSAFMILIGLQGVLAYSKLKKAQFPVDFLAIYKKATAIRFITLMVGVAFLAVLMMLRS